MHVLKIYFKSQKSTLFIYDQCYNVIALKGGIGFGANDLRGYSFRGKFQYGFFGTVRNRFFVKA